MEFSWFDFVILPLLIMMARVVDVSLDTIRVIMVAKGYRNLAPFIGFFQSLIWLITITRIMANLDNWFTYIGYAMGFALGNWPILAIGSPILAMLWDLHWAPMWGWSWKESWPLDTN